MKKTLMLIGIIVIILLSSLSLYSQGNGDLQNSINTEEKNVKATIDKYFTYRFEALKGVTQNFQLTEIVEDNDETYLYTKSDEFQMEKNKLFNVWYRTYKYRLTYSKFSIKDSVADVSLIMDVDFQYAHSDPGIESGAYNIEYKFGLKEFENNWVITSIDSDFDEYKLFKTAVIENLPKLPKRSAIDQVYYEQIRNLDSMYYFERQFDNTSSTTDNNAQSLPTATLYPYSTTNGIKYALRFAEAPVTNRLFYTPPLGCTAFVSECVWASYGGYLEGNDPKNKENIKNKVRMVAGYPEGWYGGLYPGGGGTWKWEKVTNFWDYITQPHQVGPIGNGFNNEKKYHQIRPENILLGEVLQFRNGNPNKDYAHSVFVTKRDASVFNYKNVYVCQHSQDLKNRVLLDVIVTFGSLECYMRRIAFLSANFDK
jgi:hypothetical protein